MVNLLKKDWKVLFELEKDARQSVQSIAKKAGLSKQLVSYMMKKYEENKIILAYTAIIDSSKLGYYTYRIYLRLKNLNIKKEQDKFYNFLVNLPETTIVNKLDGYWDIGFAIAVLDIFDFYHIWEKIMNYRKYIEEYKISIYSPISHFTRTMISPDPEKETSKIMVLGGGEKVNHEEIDIKILKVLAQNVRKPIVEIAHKVKKSVPFVIKRIKKMEKNGIIQGYRPLFNWNLLGYKYFKIDLHLNNHKLNKELFRFCQKHPNIIQVDQTIGGSDFEFEVYVKEKEDLKKIINEIRSKFSEVFVNYDYFAVEQPYKETFMAF